MAPLETWKERFFSLRALALIGIAIGAAALTGLVALYFRQADIYGSDFFLKLHGMDTVFGLSLIHI